jgi:hypothetical protein
MDGPRITAFGIAPDALDHAPRSGLVPLEEFEPLVSRRVVEHR